MIAARIVPYIVEYTAPVWHRRHVDSRLRRAIHPPISPYQHPPRTIPLARPLNGQAESPPWCSIIDTYPSRRLARFSRAAACVSMPLSIKCTFEQSRIAQAEGKIIGRTLAESESSRKLGQTSKVLSRDRVVLLKLLNCSSRFFVHLQDSALDVLQKSQIKSHDLDASLRLEGIRLLVERTHCVRINPIFLFFSSEIILRLDDAFVKESFDSFLRLYRMAVTFKYSEQRVSTKVDRFRVQFRVQQTLLRQRKAFENL